MTQPAPAQDELRHQLATLERMLAELAGIGAHACRAARGQAHQGVSP